MYIEPTKKHFYEDDIEYIKLNKSLSQKMDDSEINKIFKGEKSSSLYDTNYNSNHKKMQKEKANFISNKNVINFSNYSNNSFESLNQYLNFDFVLEWDKKVK